MRQVFEEHELRHLLENAHGITVRLWNVDPTGVFCGIVFDSHTCNADWKDLIKDPYEETPIDPQ